MAFGFEIGIGGSCLLVNAFITASCDALHSEFALFFINTALCSVINCIFILERDIEYRICDFRSRHLQLEAIQLSQH
jgi:hypothetical protein